MASGWITKAARAAIYLRDDVACVYCKRDLQHADRMEVTLDHIAPRSKGGHLTDPRNLVTACRSCNSSRGNKTVNAFARWQNQNPSTVWGRISTRRNRDITPYLIEAKAQLKAAKAAKKED